MRAPREHGFPVAEFDVKRYPVRVRFTRALSFILALLTTATFRAEPSTGQPMDSAPHRSFSRDIRPILAGRCFKCHGPDQKKAGLNLQDPASAFGRLKSGNVALVPGRSAESELLRRVGSADMDERMPPTGKGEPLSPAQVTLLGEWIDQGAKWEEHWAYVKPVRPSLPPISKQNWVRNDIDRFVLARLEQNGLAPSAEADRATLIRRVSLDLIGLPPTIQEIDDFLNDPNEDAYEKVVDRLLASPHYGEHQARPWLDQARYADTNGYEVDNRREIWPYRDWVIDALNRDLPFDRFTIEQIAGDLLPLATMRQKVATGFHRNTMVNTEGGTDDEEFRVAALVDRVNTTMEVWMAITMACAQCHNHKYDPFTQAEYYRLLAFFNSTADKGRDNAPSVELPTADETARRNDIQTRIAKLETELNSSRTGLAEGQAKWEKEWEQRTSSAGPNVPKDGKSAKSDASASKGHIPEAIAKILKVPIAMRDSKERADLAQHYRLIAPELAPLRERLATLRKQLVEIKPATTLVMKELDQPRSTNILIRGNHQRKGDPVSPGVPAKLHPLPARQPANRLALARWLIDPNNPLVGRVTMNRIWAQHFGRGFVETSEDFGVQGEPPSNPELLDWLATEFIPRNWSLKAMHRLIVTSAAYRQTSRAKPELLERDPYNRLFTRGPRARLDAEMVRDNALAISGLLHRPIGGPSVFPYQPDGIWLNPYSADKWQTSTKGQEYRRGLYTFWRRTAPYAAFVAFDAPSREYCCERRPRTNTPLQALATLNDTSFVECAAALARRMMLEARNNERDRAIHGFRLCVSRAPSHPEISQLVTLYRESLEKYKKDPAAAGSLANVYEVPKNLDRAELAAWTVVANVLLNLDETITRE